MKLRVLIIITLLAMGLGALVPSQVHAQAYNTSFTTSITYQNIGDDTATGVQVHFYPKPTETTPIVINVDPLPKGAGASLFVGGLSAVDPGFQGSAMIVSNQPMAATLVQLPQGSATVKNRPLSNGFTMGSSQSLIATVLKNQFDTNTLFSVQNTDSASNDITIEFYNTSAAKVHEINTTVQPGAAYFVDAGTVSQLGSSFNGSAVVTAAQNGSPGSIVSSAMELSTTGTAASAFEGVASGGTTFYMPSALCKAFGADTAYAVQNTSTTTNTSVTVLYSNGYSETQSIGPGAKKSFVACNAKKGTSGMPANFSGAATITSTQTPVIAIGKAFGSGLSTAFVGASTGYEKLALPYVRWANNSNYASGAKQRTFITIQNIGGSDIPSGDVTVTYVDKDGNTAGTHTLGQIPAGEKVNSNASSAGINEPNEFGYYGTQFGGGAIVSGPSGSQLVVVARVSTQVSAGTFASEDYNGIPAP